MRIVEFERIGERSILGIVTREAMWGSGHMKIFRVYGSVIEYMERVGWTHNLLCTYGYKPAYKTDRLEFTLKNNREPTEFVAIDGEHEIQLCAKQARRIFGLSLKAKRFVLYVTGN
jgi:hypothetical protein